LRDGDATLFSAGGVTLPVRSDGVAAGAATLALRPHRLRLIEPDGAALAGTCKRADYLGSHIEVLVRTPWGELLVFGDADAAAPPLSGAQIGLAFDPHDAIVLAR
jgi:iron(III) transport system ATP-binding protein